MKKIKLFGFALLLAITSTFCSKEGETNLPTETYILPKTVEIKDNNIPEISNISYDTNKIVQITNGTYKRVFTYSGNLIIKIEGTIDTKYQSVEEFTYQNDKLTMAIYYEYNSGVLYSKYKEIYSYTTNNTVDVKNYEVNITSGVETFANTEKRTLLNGNITKLEGGWENSVRTYEYDQKPSPFSNILGFDKLVVYNLTLGDFDSISASTNNKVKETSIGGINNTWTLLTTYIYNINNYPIEVKNNDNNSYYAKYSY